jgi:hypothetical protein
VSTHTAGPWEWREGVLYPATSSANLHAIINDGGCAVHRVAQVETWLPERDANHRLIAAAPDLLAALHVARVALAKAGHHEGLSGPLIEVDAAIAKAEAA